ncbi:ABC transporter ATP-binding protein [Candidatus Scalindua japonica]|uniref:ABC transporter ATP-binding protein n=1 Tax=Candidatus Scalindua japonica TaxID=1284222 RepID=UPI000BDF9688|nr:dipeptide ABC transporter ATP-binding protein [Candidatus Scalindua japonica]
MNLLEVKGLKTYFTTKKGMFSRTTSHVKAVDGVSFDIGRGEVLALVGESGCGKTTIGRTILRLIPATEGSVNFNGTNVLTADRKSLFNLRKKMQIVFQDPFSSLNPRMTVGQLISEGLIIHRIGTSAQRREKSAELLKKVGLSPDYMKRHPHEFSGGQRQRIGIARALSLNPDFIICDEAVSALDVSVQAQVLNLLTDLKRAFNLSYLFIAHNLSVVEHIADRIAVMYLGKIMELTDRDTLFSDPRHPYTRALFSAIPEITPGKRKKRELLKGDIPSPSSPPSGCCFHTRCPIMVERCKIEIPELRIISEGHQVACHEVHI